MGINKKTCPHHSDLTPAIVGSGNEMHVACMRCPYCDFFLGWVSKKKLVAHIEEMSNEVNRLKSILELNRFRSQSPLLESHLDINTAPLDWIWQHLLNQMLPASRDLFKAFGKLHSIESDKATIIMKSSTMRSIALSKIPELAKIFFESFGYSMLVKLIVEI